MDNYNTTWLGEFKSVIFLALGVLAIFRIPYMMPFIAYLFIVLFGMIALLRIGEVFFLKRTQNMVMDLFAAFLNLGFIVWTVLELVKYPHEEYRVFADNIFQIISAWLILLVVWGVIQGLYFIFKKNILGNLILIESILSLLLLFFFYRVISAISTENLDERVLTNFGIFCISLALISFLHARVVKFIVKKQKVEE